MDSQTTPQNLNTLISQYQVLNEIFSQLKQEFPKQIQIYDQQNAQEIMNSLR